MIAVAAYRRAIAYSDLVAEIRSLDLEPQSEQFGTPLPVASTCSHAAASLCGNVGPGRQVSRNDGPAVRRAGSSAACVAMLGLLTRGGPRNLGRNAEGTRTVGSEFAIRERRTTANDWTCGRVGVGS